MKNAIYSILCVLILCYGFSFADEPVSEQTVAPADPTLEKSEAVSVSTTPMMQDIQSLLDARHNEMKLLEEKFSQAPDEDQALRIQRQIQDLAEQTEWEVMEIQVRYLRQAGRVEQAVALENQLEEMRAPKAPREAVDRPAPAASTGRR
jgi:hypothetical protein